MLKLYYHKVMIMILILMVIFNDSVEAFYF